MAAGLMLLAFVGGPRTGHEAISLGMYLIASAIIVTYAGARLLLTPEEMGAGS